MQVKVRERGIRGHRKSKVSRGKYWETMALMTGICNYKVTGSGVVHSVGFGNDIHGKRGTLNSFYSGRKMDRAGEENSLQVGDV